MTSAVSWTTSVANALWRPMPSSPTVTYYRSLTPAKQLLLRDWLLFLRFRAVTPWPKGATTPEARVAKIVLDAFGGHVDFLDWMLEPIHDLVFTGRHVQRRRGEA
jgi:hypothetical protein